MCEKQQSGVRRAYFLSVFLKILPFSTLEAGGTLTTMPVKAVVLSIIHQWNAVLTTNASVAYGWLDAPESRSPLALKDGGIAHVNLLWTPVPQFRTGVEYMWGAKRAATPAASTAPTGRPGGSRFRPSTSSRAGVK